MRRADGAAADDDFACGAHSVELALALVDQAVAAPVLDQEPMVAGSGLHRQVTTVVRGLEERLRGVAAAAVANGQVGQADANQIGSGKVVIDRVAGAQSGLDEGFRQRIRIGDARHSKRSARAVIARCAAVIVLRFLEVGQHALIVPARIAEIGLMVVIRGRAAYVDHPVETARSAQHLAARSIDRPVARGRLRRRRERPIEWRVPKLPGALRRGNPVVIVGAAGF
jgi:hypothetical protein